MLLLTPLICQEKKLKVIAEKANIYSDPNERSFTIGTIYKGAILTLDQTEKIRNIWYYVSFYSKERSATVLGFIQASLAEMIAEIPDTAEKEEKKPTVIPTSKPKIEEKKPSITIVTPPKIKEEKLTITPVSTPKTEDRKKTIIPVLSPKTEEKKPTIIPVSLPKTDVPKEIKIKPTFFIGLQAGYAMPLENIYSRGLQYSGSICLRISKNVSVELSGLSFQSDVEGNPEALSKGKLSVMSIELSIQARFPISGRFVPYLLGGGGYYLNRINLDKEIPEAWDTLGFDIEEKVENALGYHYGAGIDLFFTKNIALNANFRYCIAKIKGSWTLTDQISGTKTSGDLGDLNLDSLMFGAGLKFCF